MTEASITNLRDSTSVDRETGAVRSVQTADLLLSEERLGEIWSPVSLERLARTYWRFLTRVTLGLIRVYYTERERFVVLLFRPFKLLTFQAPEYRLEADHGVVRWRIERGLLVARAGRQGAGYLQIDVRRLPGIDPEWARLHVEVEVANFYPAIASGISSRLYNLTQSRLHVLVTSRFLRSLTRLDLAESRIGHFADPLQAPPPDTAPPSPPDTTLSPTNPTPPPNAAPLSRTNPTPPTNTTPPPNTTPLSRTNPTPPPNTTPLSPTNPTPPPNTTPLRPPDAT